MLSLGFLFTKIGRVISKDYAAGLEEYQLTPLQAGIMMMLSTKGSMSQGQLMAALVVDKASMNQMLKSLSLAKLIKMDKDPEDKRHWRIELSAKGRDIVPDLFTVDEAVSKKYAKLLGSHSKDLQIQLWTLYQNFLEK